MTIIKNTQGDRGGKGRDAGSHIPYRKGRDFFFNFPSPMWEGKWFFSISLPAWKKKEFSSMEIRQNYTFRVRREEIFLNFPSLVTNILFVPRSWGAGTITTARATERPHHREVMRRRSDEGAPKWWMADVMNQRHPGL